MDKISQDPVVEALIYLLEKKGVITEKELNARITLVLASNSSLDDNGITQNEQVICDNSRLPPLDYAEKKVIFEMLAKVQGNKSEAARRLQITRKTLLTKLNKYSDEP